ncbi:hypothetical protein IQ255_19870 [Pleurocapsales cyanobacterium LEGE 10410]|nr:hypothetical protein [Pleurocapsales cyanobacterium LEGE 10410]
MKLSQEELDLAYKPIEIEQNKILLFWQKFWQFSNFYGEYLASLHCKKRNFRHKQGN